MANTTSVGGTFLESFLRIVVFALIVILIAIPICIACDLLGVFEALGLQF